MDYELEIIKLQQRVLELERALNIQKELLNNKVSRDKTKYMLGGIIYPKNRLVLAIVRDYVESNDVNLPKLQEVFNKSLQGSLNVIETYENAQKISDGSKRYFMADNDVLVLSDGIKVVVCTQWGKFNIDKFITRSRMLGYDIIEV